MAAAGPGTAVRRATTCSLPNARCSAATSGSTAHSACTYTYLASVAKSRDGPGVVPVVQDRAGGVDQDVLGLQIEVGRHQVVRVGRAHPARQLRGRGLDEPGERVRPRQTGLADLPVQLLPVGVPRAPFVPGVRCLACALPRPVQQRHGPPEPVEDRRVEGVRRGTLDPLEQLHPGARRRSGEAADAGAVESGDEPRRPDAQILRGLPQGGLPTDLSSSQPKRRWQWTSTLARLSAPRPNTPRLTEC